MACDLTGSGSAGAPTWQDSYVCACTADIEGNQIAEIVMGKNSTNSANARSWTRKRGTHRNSTDRACIDKPCVGRDRIQSRANT
tara:strand:- start:57 stop:308 length:252 start_codon:yes stop_codon:yes gene_type:complete